MFVKPNFTILRDLALTKWMREYNTIVLPHLNSASYQSSFAYPTMAATPSDLGVTLHLNGTGWLKPQQMLISIYL